jgi:hypothetical protein
MSTHLDYFAKSLFSFAEFCTTDGSAMIWVKEKWPNSSACKKWQL